MFAKSKRIRELTVQMDILRQSNLELQDNVTLAKEEADKSERQRSIADMQRSQMEENLNNEVNKWEEMENQRNTLVKERDELKGYLLSEKQQYRQMEENFNNEINKREEMENQRNTLVKERDELKGYLLSGNQYLQEEINYLKFHTQQLSKLHDEVVQKQWEHDDSIKQWSCTFPFERIEINENGDVYTCCSAYVKHGHSIGNAYRRGVS
jgi:chromosome segregation ATPase